jgi:hypothetical protein
MFSWDCALSLGRRAVAAHRRPAFAAALWWALRRWPIPLQASSCPSTRRRPACADSDSSIFQLLHINLYKQMYRLASRRRSGGWFKWSTFWMGRSTILRASSCHKPRLDRRAGQCSLAINSVVAPCRFDSCIGGLSSVQILPSHLPSSRRIWAS